MHRYRTHTCNQLRRENVGETVRLSGWVHRKRDHGNLLFVDLRDHYGLTQRVIDTEGANFAAVDAVRVESVVTVTGKLVRRSDDTVNPKLETGEVVAGGDQRVGHGVTSRRPWGTGTLTQ